MGRLRRPYLPGTVFHLTARTIRRELTITPPLRTDALEVLAEVVPRSGFRLLAVAIMSNHIHVVAQQGEAPLAALMQPTLRRLALCLQRAHRLEGPMFWRHYASMPCLNPSHARNAIVYTHLNPVRAGLCSRPSDYPWTSHALYAGEASGDLPRALHSIEPVLDPDHALPLFATTAPASRKALREDYRRFVDWRLRADEDEEEGPKAEEPSSTLLVPGWWSDGTWSSTLSPLFHAPSPRGFAGIVRGLPPGRPDMATIARETLALEGSRLSLDLIRGRHGGREGSRLRHAIIRRLHTAGYRNVPIAAFLGIADSTVSYALTRPTQRE